jgi:hypothetical protein
MAFFKWHHLLLYKELLALAEADYTAFETGSLQKVSVELRKVDEDVIKVSDVGSDRQKYAS